MTHNTLIATSLDAQGFAPFGDIISVTSAGAPRIINYGHTQRHETPARLDLSAENGRAGISIFRSTPLPIPIKVEVMERHRLSSQAFYPLGTHPYLVIVAPKGDFDVSAIRAFIASPDQGVNYHAGVWHHYLLALHEVSDFLVIDRNGPGKNCDEVRLQPHIKVEFVS